MSPSSAPARIALGPQLLRLNSSTRHPRRRPNRRPPNNLPFPPTVNVSAIACNTPVTRVRDTPLTLSGQKNSAQLHPGALMEKNRMLKKLSGLLVVTLILSGALYSQGALLINGAGATFPNPFYSKWIDEYH